MLNVFFAILFIFGSGPAPAMFAWATEIARVLHILSIAWPSTAQYVIRIASMLLVNSLVARFFTTAEDQTATTAIGLVFRLDTMAMFIAMGWGSAAQTFVGQNLGAKQEERAMRAGWIPHRFARSQSERDRICLMPRTRIAHTLGA